MPRSQTERKRALNRERVRRYRERKDLKDLVRVEVYVRPEDVASVRELAERLNRRAALNGVES